MLAGTMRRARLFVLIPVAVAAVWLTTQAMAYDEKVWLDQFAALRTHMAQHYANLDWMVEHRKMDLPSLVASTEADLRGAVIPWQASRAMRRFIAAFNDPHLKVEPYKPPPLEATPAPAADGSETPAPPDTRTCKERGFRVRDRSFRFPFEKAEGWTPAGGAWFPAGSFGDVGVIRIVLFGEDGYLEACEEVGAERVRERLTREVHATIGTLKQRKVRALVLDITGNGGGTNWVNDITSMVTPRALRRRKAVLMEPPCDRAAVWRGERVCSGLTGSEESTMQGEGAWEGPLAVLVDGGTASASEDLVVWLKESGAATIIGERTYGAGCGYVNGGAPARLEPIGITVLMPNCSRFLSDGTNEVEGIQPDVPLPIRKGAAAERLQRLVAALPKS